MSITLVPYNQAMRLGQGFNTYLQQICMDNVVSFVPADVTTAAPTPGDGVTPGQDTHTSNPTTETIDPSEIPQVVTYSYQFTNQLSDVIENLSVSAAAGIKVGTVQASGRGSYLNTTKFKESDLNFVCNVKVINNITSLDKSKIVFNKIANVNQSNFLTYYGDAFISGFIEGGEFNSIINIKLKDGVDKKEVTAQLQIEGTGGAFSLEGEGAWSKSAMSSFAQTSVSVNWSGGGQIKDPTSGWDIDTMLTSAAAFPGNVAVSPQQSWAILTKYNNLKSFVESDTQYAVLDYANAKVYTDMLYDAFCEYQCLFEKIHDMMHNPSNYKVKSVPEAILLTVPALVDARNSMRQQMAKIVTIVDAITADPAKALIIPTEPDTGKPIPEFLAPELFDSRLPERIIQEPGPTPDPTPTPPPYVPQRDSLQISETIGWVGGAAFPVTLFSDHDQLIFQNWDFPCGFISLTVANNLLAIGVIPTPLLGDVPPKQPNPDNLPVHGTKPPPPGANYDFTYVDLEERIVGVSVAYEPANALHHVEFRTNKERVLKIGSNGMLRGKTQEVNAPVGWGLKGLVGQVDERGRLFGLGAIWDKLDIGPHRIATQ